MSHKPSGAQLRRGLLFVVFITLAVQVLEFYGWLQSAEDKILDHLVLKGSPAKTESPIVTLEIDDQSYRQCFENKSPLDPQTLLRAVKFADASGAAVIGIDVITDDKAYLNADFNEWQNEVWIADNSAEQQTVPVWNWMLGRSNEFSANPGKVFGEERSPGHPSWGIPIFPADSDASIRKTYQLVRSEGSLQPMASWALNIAQRYCEKWPGKCSCEKAPLVCKKDGVREGDRGTEPLFISYGGPPPARFQFRDVFRCDEVKQPESSEYSSVSLERKYLRPLPNGSLSDVFTSTISGKIVLIGGQYRAARDTYETPVGSIPGVLINGYAIQSQIQGNLLPEEHRPYAILLDLAAGSSLVLISFFFGEFVEKWTLLVIAGAVTGGAIFFAYELGPQFLPGSVAILLGMMIHLVLHGHDHEIETREQKSLAEAMQRRVRFWFLARRREQTRRRRHYEP